MLIQIILSLFILFAIVRLFAKFKRYDIKMSEFWAWFIFWLLAFLAVWLPDFLTKLANIVGIGRGADLVLYVGIIIIFYLIFRIYVHLERIERNITKITRKDAFEETDDKIK